MNFRKRNGFLKSTLKAFLELMQNEILSEQYARMNGFMQNINPAVKVVFLLIMIITTSLITNSMSLLFLVFIAILLVNLSKLSLMGYLKRVWLVFPMLTLLVSLPAITNFLIDGTPIFYIFNWGDNQSIYVTKEGVQKVSIMFVRLGISISWGYLLIMTTRWVDIMAALRFIRVPSIIVSIIDMAYRYLFLLARTATEMFEAREIRTVGKLKNSSNRKFLGNSVATLFIKSSKIGEEVYYSMLCRGYNGEIRTVRKITFVVKDVFIGIILLLLVLVVIIVNNFGK